MQGQHYRFSGVGIECCTGIRFGRLTRTDGSKGKGQLHRAVLGELGVAVGQSCCGWKLLWDRFGIGGRDVAAGVEAGLTIPRYSVQILKSEATQDYRTESALFFFFFVSRVIRDESHCRLVKRVCESERE